MEYKNVSFDVGVYTGNKEYVGETNIINLVTNEKIKVYIKKITDVDAMIYQLCLKEDPKEALGEIMLYAAEKEENHEYEIEVLYIESYKRGKYKKIGTKLMRVAFGVSQVFGCRGCLWLNATRSAKPFYLKIGLEPRVSGRKLNELYLPQKSIECWQKKKSILTEDYKKELRSSVLQNSGCEEGVNLLS